MHSGADALRQKEQPRRQQTRARRQPLPDTGSHARAVVDGLTSQHGRRFRPVIAARLARRDEQVRSTAVFAERSCCETLLMSEPDTPIRRSAACGCPSACGRAPGSRSTGTVIGSQRTAGVKPLRAGSSDIENHAIEPTGCEVADGNDRRVCGRGVHAQSQLAAVRRLVHEVDRAVEQRAWAPRPCYRPAPPGSAPAACERAAWQARQSRESRSPRGMRRSSTIGSGRGDGLEGSGRKPGSENAQAAAGASGAAPPTQRQMFELEGRLPAAHSRSGAPTAASCEPLTVDRGRERPGSSSGTA